ncbi:CLUMA_CG009055, isoform A [Clunio marinus]|uniref:CLUMA_CG009055, isoform A n=1 Tax=Clunio marinus TaxID=568069 RepID=A0A1J1I7P7_9DIPT|nr:CLUMA_CG009055, isoform A [Clunio marinus]
MSEIIQVSCNFPLLNGHCKAEKFNKLVKNEKNELRNAFEKVVGRFECVNYLMTFLEFSLIMFIRVEPC